MQLAGLALGLELAGGGRQHVAGGVHQRPHVVHQSRGDRERRDRGGADEGGDHQRVGLKRDAARHRPHERDRTVAADHAQMIARHEPGREPQRGQQPAHEQERQAVPQQVHGERRPRQPQQPAARAQHHDEHHRARHADADAGPVAEVVALQAREHGAEHPERKAQRDRDARDQHHLAHHRDLARFDAEPVVKLPGRDRAEREHHGAHHREQRERGADRAVQPVMIAERVVARHVAHQRGPDPLVEQSEVAGQREHRHPQAVVAVPHQVHHDGGQHEAHRAADEESQIVGDDVAQDPNAPHASLPPGHGAARGAAGSHESPPMASGEV